MPRYQFTLAGASRVVNDTWATEGVNYSRPVSAGEYDMKALLAVNPARVLNVYVVYAVKDQLPVGPPKPLPPAPVRGYSLFPRAV